MFILIFLKLNSIYLIKDNDFCGWKNEIKSSNQQPKIAWKLETGNSGLQTNTGPQFGKTLLKNKT